ncbi:SsgA family sporulation/cell division regulator [Streptomyces sp. NPDC004284]|uniref:SsgA family sporulation/cell division regulator n=1 Tax=Streptomyces sp. NPDC004284 TaxID=3364695 RepID=UPI0036738907
MSSNDPDRRGPRTAAHGLPPLLVDVQQDQEGHQDLRIEFGFDPARPFVVTITFISTCQPPVTWCVGRDLLYEGLFSPRGLGDVQVWPAHPGGEPTAWLRLRPYGMPALFELPVLPLAAWLEHGYRIVPAGSDLDGVDWDAVAASILRGGEVPSD